MYARSRNIFRRSTHERRLHCGALALLVVGCYQRRTTLVRISSDRRYPYNGGKKLPDRPRQLQGILYDTDLWP